MARNARLVDHIHIDLAWAEKEALETGKAARRFADRTSAASMEAYQLRLWFASLAYVLLSALRRLVLAHTQLARATCGTIRRTLLKIGAQVTRSVRRVRFAMVSACPYEPEFRIAHARLCN